MGVSDGLLQLFDFMKVIHRLFKLNAQELSGIRLFCKGSSLLFFGKKFVHYDTAPFDSIEREECSDSLSCFLGRWRDAGNALGNQRDIIRRNRYGDLREKVPDQLGGVIPSGIFEVEKTEGAIRSDQAVVKAEIGWRNAAFVWRQNGV